MALPLSADTVLQNRYRIIRPLGQGGFGRTYLAEDQGRFNEQCAIKEFVPRQGEDHFSAKASELFQREAAILYQIQHPQIPQFRAIFEVDQRLFLVQDYVDGTTYRDLLNQRRSMGQGFSESEIRLFLQQILPVLGHIHAKGIIHRDISPDNIILRNGDRLPVLIDFGVVKEVVTRIQLTEATVPATTVGKVGYAPSEQMQSGRAYPNSDLYALAVTAVVLLTGKEPPELFDDVQLTWHWQRYVSVSPALAQVLTKALSHRPGDRFQSAGEMAQALGLTLTNPISAPGTPPVTPIAPAAPVATVAVGRPYAATTGIAPGDRATQVVGTGSSPTAQEESVWENPWAVGALGLGLAVVAGIGGWGVINALEAQRPTPTPTAIETPEPSPEPTPLTPFPTAAPTPVEFDEALPLQGGTATQVRGNLRANETMNYRIQGVAGQTLRAQLSGEGVLLTVLGPNGRVLDGGAERVLGWSGVLPFDGEYVVQLRPVSGLEQSNYNLTLTLENPAPEPTPEPTPTPTPEPTPVQPSISEEQVNIPMGSDGVRVSNVVGRGRLYRYRVFVREGQVLTAELESGAAAFAVRMPTGQLVDDADQVISWQGQLPLGGEYAIEVSAPQETSFTLRIGVK